MAIIPLLFFLLKLWQYNEPGKIYQILWFCNISNLVLAIAIFISNANLILVCTIILSIGLPIWIFDFLYFKDFHFFSLLTHIISPALGFWLARNMRFTIHVLWLTPTYYVALQILARLVSPPELNINVAYTVYEPVRAIFTNFYLYSAANLLGLFAFTLLVYATLKKVAVLNDSES